jgi:hypothetical protein
MKEKRDFSLRRKTRPLTPEKLMDILDKTEGGERAREAYKRLTGMNPPPEVDEIVVEVQDGNLY